MIFVVNSSPPRPIATGSIRSVPASLAKLERHIGGRVLIPTDDGYEEAVSPAGLDARPVIVVVPASASDVAVAVAFAASHHLAVSTRPAAGAMLIVPTALAHLEIDPDAWTARVEPGVTGIQVLREGQQFGLAPVLDTEADKGIVSSVVGGRAGWLARRFGLGGGHVRGVELVTADGVIRSVSIEENPDLFRAVVEGKSDAAGVVTALDIDLVPVGPVLAGELGYGDVEFGSVVERYVAWVEETPAELTASLISQPSDDPSVVIRGCHVGAGGDADDLLDFWRLWRVPDIDRWHRTGFGDFAASLEPASSGRRLSTTHWLTDSRPDIVAGLAAVLSRSTGLDEPHIESVQIIDLGPGSRSVTASPAPGRWCLTLSGSASDPVGISALATYLTGVARDLPVVGRQPAFGS